MRCLPEHYYNININYINNFDSNLGKNTLKGTKSGEYKLINITSYRNYWPNFAIVMTTTQKLMDSIGLKEILKHQKIGNAITLLNFPTRC